MNPKPPQPVCGARGAWIRIRVAGANRCSAGRHSDSVGVLSFGGLLAGSLEWMDSLVVCGSSSFVSADAKIPIMPVEFSPPLDEVNRNRRRMEEVPRLVKGERRARAERTAAARDEYPGDQRADLLGPQDDSQVYAGSRGGAGVRPTCSAAEQARCVGM